MIIFERNIKNRSMLETKFKRAAGLARTAWRGICRSCRTPSALGARLMLALASSAALAPGASIAAPPAVRQIDIADYRSYLADDHPVRQGMLKFAQLVEARSAGTLHVTARTDALPGSPAKQIAALRSGTDGAPALMLVATTGLAGVVQEFELLDLPFLLRDEREADALLDGDFGNALLAHLAPTGLVGLAWWENGFRQITTSGAPIRQADDMRGRNFRVIGEPVFIDTLRAMGARPQALPFGELYAALKSQRVDAQDNFYAQILAGRLYEVQSSLTVSNHSYSPLVLVANAAFWQGLTSEQQRVLQPAASEAGQFQRQATRAEARLARATLAQHGLQINQLAPAERQKLEEMTAPVRSSYFARHEQGLWRLYQERAH